MALLLLPLLPPLTPAQAQENRLERIERWIGQLGSESHVERSRAERALRTAGALAVEPLKRALRGERDAETIFRMQTLLVELDDDFLTLAASLDDHNANIRRYAEEALTMRFHDASHENQRFDDPFAWHPNQVETPRRLNQIQLGIEENLTASPYELLQIVRREVPIILTPAVYEDHALLHSRHEFSTRQLVTAQHAVHALSEVLGLRHTLLRFGTNICVLMMRNRADCVQVETARDAVLTLCRLVLHDIEQARRDAFTEIGRLFATRPEVMELLSHARERTGNPVLGNVVRALVLSGAPAHEVLGPLEPQLGGTVVELWGTQELWPVRQAAARALVSWRPADPRPPHQRDDASLLPDGWEEQRRTFYDFTLEVLEAQVQAEDPVCRYLAVWAIGALRPLWLGMQAESDGEANPGAGAYLDDLPAKPPAVLREALVTTLNDDAEIARAALDALSHLRLSLPNAVDKALELGVEATDKRLEQAVLRYLGLVGTTELFDRVIERYDADATRDMRTFLAELLAEARDEETLHKILEILKNETERDVGMRMVPAFSEAFDHRDAWPALEDMLASEDTAVRTYAREIIVRSGLPGRERRIRALLESIDQKLLNEAPALAEVQERQTELRDKLRELDNESQDAEAQLRAELREVRDIVERLERERVELLTEQVQLRLVLVRLGDDSEFNALRDTIVSGHYAQVTREAAVGLGESRHQNALSTFEEAYAGGQESNQLAAVHGIDAMARSAADAGDAATVRNLFTAIHRLGQPQSAAVQQLLNTVRNKFWSSDGYNEVARRHAERQAEQAQLRYPAEPPNPDNLLQATR